MPENQKSKRRNTIGSNEELNKAKRRNSFFNRRNTVGAADKPKKTKDENFFRKSFSKIRNPKRTKVLKIGEKEYSSYKELRKPSITLIHSIKPQIIKQTEQYSNKINELMNKYLESLNLDDEKSMEFRNKISADYLVPITGPRRAVVGNEKALDMFWKNAESESGNIKNEEAFNKIADDTSLLDLKETKPWCDCATYFSAQLLKNFNTQHEKSIKKQSELFEECCDKFEKLMNSNPKIIIKNLKEEIKEALVNSDNIADFEEKVFKNGGFKKEICDSKVYSSSPDERLNGLKATAEKIRKLLKNEKQEIENLKYYSEKLLQYKKNKMLSNAEIEKIQNTLEKMGPGKNFEAFWRKNVSQKIGKSTADSTANKSDLKSKVFSDIKHLLQPILDKLELQSKLKEISVKSKNNYLIIGKNTFKNYKELEKSCKEMISKYLIKEQKRVKKIISTINTVHDIAKKHLSDKDIKVLNAELDTSRREINSSIVAINTYRTMLDELWEKDKKDKKEQELNQKKFLSIVKKPDKLKDEKISQKRYCAAFKSAQILSNFTSENANTKNKQKNIINRCINKIKILMGVGDLSEERKWKKVKINKQSNRNNIIGNRKIKES